MQRWIPLPTGRSLDARFRDRADAGQQLAEKLSKYSARGDVIVLALPRGGVPVAYEVAKALNAPLDVFLVRKIGLPSHEEFAMGAIASGGTVLINDEVTRTYGVSQQHVDAAIARERSELERREREYRGPRKLPDLRGRTVILVDDGLATGASMRAAAAAVRALGPARIVVAVPIAPAESCEVLREEADEVVCALTPEPFYAVGLWYQDFAQMTDAEVTDLLERGRRELPATASPRET